ncbi:OLC1v1028092C2 [Oldenlandia corymbosa var. corymbosa]|uniref:OLC1v1028092C2 n=1 Tax=Oldenlandia corymbosa var. corymbosa TaxID=529605 RepID=A0AAV1CC40_OLDCO|nr:OLC1v1028092C2 [Oldenlandia corymbosa var. corymbosa]
MLQSYTCRELSIVGEHFQNPIRSPFLLKPRFKLQCSSKTLPFPTRCVANGRKPKRYGGILPPILKSLESETDVEKVLESNHGKLNPKELTVILKEQRSWEKVLRVFDWMKSQKDYVPNVIHYNVVLRSLGKAKRWDELRLCWIDMAKKGVFPTNNTYAMLVDVYGKSGLVKESLLWIKHMKLRGIFPDEVTMNTVVRVLKDAGEYDRGIRFYKDWCTGDIDLDDLDLDSLEDMESKEGLGPVSLKHFLLTELFRTGSRNSPSSGWGLKDGEISVQTPRLTATYNTLIDLYGKAGRLKEAGDVFADMLKLGVAFDTITFNTMIFISGSHGFLSEAEELLVKMKEKGINPDTKTYNILLSLYAEAGNIDVALQYYKKIREDGLFPDDVTCRAVLQALCERKMVQEVEAVLKEMEKLRKYIDDRSLAFVMKMYVDEGSNEKANLLLKQFQLRNTLSSRSCAAVMDVYAEKGLWAEAEAIFLRKMDIFGQKKEVVEYNVLIKAYGKAKLYDKAFSLFRGMKNHGTWPDECTFNSIIQMFAGSELVDQARDLIAEMLEAGFKPSCLTFSSVVANYAQSGRLSEAVSVFQEMSKLGIKPNEVVFGSLIDGCAEAGNFEEAVGYFQEMKESGIPVNQIVLTSLIKAYGKAGYAEGAKQLYEKMKHLDGGPDIVASNSMLNLYAELGMVSEARLIFDHLKERGWADGVTFATMMYVYKNMGMLDEAIAVAEEMKSSGLLRDCVAFNKVMACYATSGQLVACGELLHDMVEQKLLPDIGTFRVLFTVLKKGELPTEAVRQLESSYQEGKPFARQAVITSVFSVVGLHEYALESCEIFLKAEMGLGLFAYNAAIYAYGASGRSDDALNIFMRMQDEGVEPDIVTLIHLVSCYGKTGMIEGIKRIYGQLKLGDIDPNESLYMAIVDAYRSANRNDLADMVNQEMRLAFEAYQNSDSESENVPFSFHLQRLDEALTTVC